jgi:hypothetical protein
VSAWAFQRLEDVRDDKGQQPCIAPDVLAEICRRREAADRLLVMLLALTMEPDGGSI